MLQGVSYLRVLNLCRQLRQCSGRRETKTQHRLGHGIPLPGTEPEPVQLAKNLDPADGPLEVGIGVDVRQRAKRQIRFRTRKIVELAARCYREHPGRIAPIKAEHLRARIAEPLSGDQSQRGGLARTGWPDDQRVSEILHMQVDPERCRAACGGEQKRRAVLRHQRGRVLTQARPHGCCRQHIGKVQRVQQNPAYVAVAIPRQRAAPRFHGVHGLHPARETEVLDGFYHPARALVKPSPVLVEADHVCRVLRELDIPRGCDSHCGFRVCSHFLRVDVDRPALRIEDLILPTADSRTPFLAVHVEHPTGLHRIDEDRSGIPAVLNRQRIEFSQNARRAQPREPVDRNHPDVLPADAWLNPSMEVFARQQLVQITGNLRKSKRVVLTADAPPHVAKQAIMHLGEPEVVSRRESLQTLGLEELAEHVLEGLHPVPESFQDLLCCPRAAPGALAVEHPALHTLLGLDRRHVRQGEKVLGFEVRTLLHELLAALVVDQACNRVRERTLFRVAGCAGPDGIALDHPAAAKSKDGIQAGAQRVHLGRRGGHHVRAAIRPAGQQ